MVCHTHTQALALPVASGHGGSVARVISVSDGIKSRANLVLSDDVLAAKYCVGGEGGVRGEVLK